MWHWVTMSQKLAYFHGGIAFRCDVFLCYTVSQNRKYKPEKPVLLTLRKTICMNE